MDNLFSRIEMLDNQPSPSTLDLLGRAQDHLDLHSANVPSYLNSSHSLESELLFVEDDI